MLMEKAEKIRLADEMTKDGYTAEEIAKKLGVTSRTVNNWRKRMGSVSPYKGRPAGRKDLAERQREEEVSFLRPGPRPADMQCGISDEQVVMRCQSVYDFTESIARLKPEFRDQVGLPKRFKKIYDNGKRY